jgi:hypothetical protein
MIITLEIEFLSMNENRMANMQQIQNDADFFFFHYKYAGDHEYAL